TQPCGPSDPGAGTHTAAPAGAGSRDGGQRDERSNEQDAAAHTNNNVCARPNLHQRPRAYVADSLACSPHRLGALNEADPTHLPTAFLRAAAENVRARKHLQHGKSRTLAPCANDEQPPDSTGSPV